MWSILSILNFIVYIVLPSLYTFISVKRPTDNFISSADKFRPEPSCFPGWELTEAKSWFASFTVPEYAGISLESCLWEPVLWGIYDRRGSGYNEVPLVLWKLTFFGWHSRQICIALSLSKQVYLVLPKCIFMKEWMKSGLVSQISSEILWWKSLRNDTFWWNLLGSE